MPQPKPHWHTHLVSGGAVSHHSIWCTFGRRQGNLSGIRSDEREFPRSVTETPRLRQVGRTHFGLVGSSFPSEPSGSNHKHWELVVSDELFANVGVHCGMAHKYTVYNECMIVYIIHTYTYLYVCMHACECLCFNIYLLEVQNATFKKPIIRNTEKIL